MTDVNDELLGVLTEEERAAFLADDDDADAEAKTPEADDEAQDAPEVENDDPPAEDEDDTTGEEAEDDTAEMAPPDDDTADTPAPEKTEDAPGEQNYTPVSAESYDGRIKSTRAEIRRLTDAYENGDDDAPEDDEALAAEVSKLEKQVEDLIGDRAVAAHHQRQWTERWWSTVEAYKAANPGLWAEGVSELWDAEVRKVTGSGNAKEQALPMQKKLELAHRRLAASADLFDIDVQAPKSARAKAKDSESPAPKKAEAGPDPKAKAVAPKTIAKIPASEVSGTDDGKFAHLRQLEKSNDVEKYESALAKLSESDRDEYLSMA